MTRYEVLVNAAGVYSNGHVVQEQLPQMMYMRG